MITPVQSNINNSQTFGSMNVERIRVPRKSNANVSFEGNPVSGGAKKATGFAKKAFVTVKNAIKKGFKNIIHSKFVQGAKKNIKKFFKGAADFVRNIPKKVSEKFHNLKNKKA